MEEDTKDDLGGWGIQEEEKKKKTVGTAFGEDMWGGGDDAGLGDLDLGELGDLGEEVN